MRELVEAAARVGTLALVAVAFGLGFGEAAVGLDLLVPGEVGMVLAGAVAAAGDAPLPLVIAAGAAGAAAGDSAGYWLGRRYGLTLVRRWRWTRRRLAPSAERARRYFERRGGAAVFAARFVGALRAVVPVVAGTARMPYGRFLAWDLPAALLWATAVVSLGYFVGEEVAAAVDRVGLVISIVVIAALAGVFILGRRRSRNRVAAADVEEAAGPSALPAGGSRRDLGAKGRRVVSPGGTVRRSDGSTPLNGRRDDRY
jgi:membrane protein DedA with SNARE-associated domain